MVPSERDAAGRATRLPSSVRLDAVSRYHGSFRAVDAVSLEIRDGELMTFLGPSGSGKTTVLNMIAGFDVPTSGEIHIGERLVTRMPPHRRDIGMVFQRYTLFPHMSVAQNVDFPLQVRNVPRAERPRRVAEALRLVRLEEFAHRRPGQLSGGQQQRVALARGLVYDPRLILMDEPLGALDKKLREEIQDEIRHLHRRLGVTIIYVTHDQEEALRLSDRITVMNRGRIEQTGTPEDLYDRPANLFVAQFLGNSVVMPGTLAEAGPGGGRIALPDGTVVAVASLPAGLAGGADVSLMARPENLTLADRPLESLNAVPVTIDETVFLGSGVTVTAMTADGRALTFAQPHARDGAPPALGAAKFLCWDPARTRVFPR